MTERPDIDAIERDHRPWQLTPSCAPMVSQLCAYVRELEDTIAGFTLVVGDQRARITELETKVSDLELALTNAHNLIRLRGES